MSKVAVVYWSGTGNTETMAQEIAKGVESAGNTATVITVSDFSAAKVAEYDILAFGCPAMGAECLEEGEFEPVFEECKPELKSKKVALFGSYDWGDGEWIRTWEDDCKSSGINLIAQSLIINNTPDSTGCADCNAFGKSLA